jgi:hypothetical protein
MHPRLRTSLPLLGLAVAVLLVPGCARGRDVKHPPAQPAKQAQPAQQAQQAVAENDPNLEVGRNKEKKETAREMALAKARERVAQTLTATYPEVGDWQPSLDDLRKHSLVRPEGQPQRVRVGDEEVWQVVYRVDVTTPKLQELRKLAMHQALLHRLEQRHKSVLLVLAAVVALLLVVAGYLRLEEATRGYYTGLLRLGAAALLLLAGAGLWLLR